jgi:hypothetical protein
VKSFGENFVIIRDPNNAIEIASILKGLLANPARRASLSAAVREQSLQLSWSETVAGYLRTYSQLRALPTHSLPA